LLAAQLVAPIGQPAGCVPPRSKGPNGALAFSPQKRLGRFVDFHVTLAFSLQSARAGFLIFTGSWPSDSQPKCLGRTQSLWWECRSSTLGIPDINPRVCRTLHNGKPQTAKLRRERSLSEVSHMWYWKIVITELPEKGTPALVVASAWSLLSRRSNPIPETSLCLHRDNIPPPGLEPGSLG
jgi:hypothetical protein